MLAVLAAIASLDNATQVRIAARTGLDKRTVLTLIQMARAQAGVTIIKEGPVYRLADWGPVICPDGAAMALAGELGPHQTQRRADPPEVNPSNAASN